MGSGVVVGIHTVVTGMPGCTITVLLTEVTFPVFLLFVRTFFTPVSFFPPATTPSDGTGDGHLGSFFAS